MRCCFVGQPIALIIAMLAVGFGGGCAREMRQADGWTVVASDHRSLKDDAPQAPRNLAGPARFPVQAPHAAKPPKLTRPMPAAARSAPDPGQTSQPIAPSAAEKMSSSPPPPAAPPAPAATSLLTPELARQACNFTESCVDELRALIEHPTRDWIGKPVEPRSYANGLMLHAYRALRPSLTCRELVAALAEIERADVALQLPIPGVSEDQAARILTLNAVVSRELKVDLAARC